MLQGVRRLAVRRRQQTVPSWQTNSHSGSLQLHKQHIQRRLRDYAALFPGQQRRRADIDRVKQRMTVHAQNWDRVNQQDVKGKTMRICCRFAAAIVCTSRFLWLSQAKLQKAQIRSTIAVAESIVELAAGPGAASATREQLQA